MVGRVVSNAWSSRPCSVPRPGNFAEACAVHVDRSRDTTEGRMIPEPVKPHDRSHNHWIAQYSS
jgi:hypothetical protein